MSYNFVGDYMKIARLITTVDAHTAGENVRVITGGIPYIPGETIVEKMEYCKKELDHLRTALMYEPRGYRAMFGCILTAPTTNDADLGILFMGAPGYLDMCGHALIGATTVVIETGIIKATEPTTIIKWDTCAGLITTMANFENERVQSVTFRGTPSFLYKSNVTIEVRRLGKILVDISFGGVFTVIVSAKDLGIKVIPDYSNRILDIGERVLNAINEQVEIKHPDHPHVETVGQVMITDDPVNPSANYRNAVVCCHESGRSKMAIDRSPCGTGTCARMAQLFSDGELKLNREFIHESIIGTLFRGKLVEEVHVGDYRAAVPEVTGTAYVTGIHQFVLDRDDPLKYGFLL